MSLYHVPVLRAGRDYKSLDTVEVKSHRDGTPLAEVSQANAGLVRRDLKKAAKHAAKLREVPVRELVERIGAAREIFLEADLPLEEGGPTLGPDRYVELLSSTSGMPHAMCRANMMKIASVMGNLPTVLRGLMRGLDLDVLDGGLGSQDDVPVWYTPDTDSLGVILPSNSPGVHSLWVPSIALKTPLILKPGREEPWTPMRIARALLAAGIPPEALSLYPTDHDGSGTILDTCGRAMLFGDERVTKAYASNPAVEVHGPGRSKVLLGADVAANWRDHLDVIVASVSDNGGRSCINASTIMTPSHGDEIAEALAERLVAIEPRAPEDPEAILSAFAKPVVAEAIDGMVQQGLDAGGAVDVTARHRQGDRRVEHAGGAYLRPTVVRCDSMDHPLANTEFLFPFASVVEVPQDEFLGRMGPSLVVTVLSKDEALLDSLVASDVVYRLNVGPIPTTIVEWNQPHEGNLFEFLYSRRAYQKAQGW